MTSETRGVSPLEDLGADSFWDKQTVGWPPSWVKFLGLGLFTVFSRSHLIGAIILELGIINARESSWGVFTYTRDNASGFRFLEPGGRIRWTGIGWRIGLSLFACWMYSRFLWSVSTWNGCLTPSSQCLHSSSTSLAASNSRSPTYMIVPFSLCKAVGKECKWMRLVLPPLGQHHSNPFVRRIDLHDEGFIWVRENKNRCRGKMAFEFAEGQLCFRSPIKAGCVPLGEGR